MELQSLGKLGRQQHGVFTSAQVFALGITRRQLRHQIAIGHLEKVRLGILRVSGSRRSFEQSAMGAVLAAGPGAVLSHGAAARLWGITALDDAALEVTTCRLAQRRLPGVVTHRSIAFHSVDHTTRCDVPVTSFARTLIDVSGRRAASQLGEALDIGIRQSIVTLNELRQCVSGVAPAPGRRLSRINEVLSRRIPGFDDLESDLEVRAFRQLAASELELPELQFRLNLPRRSVRIDMAYPSHKLAIELDGWKYHSSRSAFDSDRARANELVMAGWTVLRFTSSTVDAELVDTVRAALTERVA